MESVEWDGYTQRKRYTIEYIAGLLSAYLTWRKLGLGAKGQIADAALS